MIAGCGAGHKAVAIGQERRAEIDAVDIEDFVPAELKPLPAVRFQVASFCQLPFESNSFAAIFYRHVIEHVDDPVAVKTNMSPTRVSVTRNGTDFSNGISLNEFG